MDVHCDFCGYDFDPSCHESQGCSGCPLQRNCQHLSCPRCGYPVLGEATLFRWTRQLKEKLQKIQSTGAVKRG